MTRFVRVRSAGRGDAKHEFDAAVDIVAAYPERYKILDEKPVRNPRPTKYVTAASRQSAGQETGGDTEKEKADA